jgi:HPt (histidine-containing phosphotransfer) domain-containing protein
MAEPAVDPRQTALTRIPGLALEVGLRTVGGREESLVRLVRRYEELHAGDGQTLKSAISGGQPGAALSLAHSVKGAAGFLGLVQIQAVAAELEAALREGSTGAPLEALLDRFEAENLGTCGAIRAHLG